MKTTEKETALASWLACALDSSTDRSSWSRGSTSTQSQEAARAREEDRRRRRGGVGVVTAPPGLGVHCRGGGKPAAIFRVVISGCRGGAHGRRTSSGDGQQR